MVYAIRPFTDALRTAREKKGQSQRALGSKIGMPQGRLSKIENAAVDLQTSNFLGLARALDLEVVLIPRSLAPGRYQSHPPDGADGKSGGSAAPGLRSGRRRGR